MRSRRNFIISGIKRLVTLSAIAPFVLSMAKSTYGTVKRLLPKNTKLEDLIHEHPGQLDPSQINITALRDFQTAGEKESYFNQSTWRLNINGALKNELSLDYLSMVDLPAIEKKVLLICPGFFAQYGSWKGIDMKRLLEKCQVKTDASRVLFSAPMRSKLNKKNKNEIDIETVKANKAFLAYQVNGQVLPQKHGFPLRLIVEDAHGFNWVKFVNSMEIV